MLFSNICKVGTLTALALAITACGSNSPDTPTNNPTTIPTKPADKAKAEADKAKAEADAKAKAEAEKARLEAEAKAKADKAKAEADAKAEAEKKAQAEKARLEAEAKAKADKAKAEADAKAKAEADKAKAEADKAKAEAEKAKAEAEKAQKAKDEAEKARLEAEAKAKADKAKAEADAKAKAEAEKKAQAEKARLEAEAKAKAEAELARTQPLPYTHKTHVGEDTGKVDMAFFEPITKDSWNNTDLLETKIIPADNSHERSVARQVSSSSIVNGKTTSINATYYTHSYNLSNAGIAAIFGRGLYNGQDVSAFLYAYGGRPTNANELDTLKGEAVYTGKGYFDGDQLNMETVIKANFDNKKVSGSMTTADRTAQYLHDIQLVETDIRRENGIINFSGKAIDQTNQQVGILHGDYEGMFVGRGATEVVGKVTVALPNDEIESLSGVFIGSK